MVNQDTGYCPAHAPGGREEMRRRGLKGGRRTKEAWKRPGVTAEELGTLESLADAQRWLTVIASAVATGRLDRGDAQAATRAIEVWLKAADSLTEEQVQALQEKLDAVQAGRKPLRSVP